MSNFDESKHKRDNDGKFASKGGGDTPAEVKRAGELAGKNEMTPADKIASVHIERGKDNLLPELNEKDLAKVGLTKNKPVLVKASITERNAERHPDINEDDRDRIIGEALYSPAEIFKGHETKPYHTFVKPMRLSPKDSNSIDYGLALLDVSESKESFEVVHWHWIGSESLEKMKKKTK